jgi:hypothetical protein
MSKIITLVRGKVRVLTPGLLSHTAPIQLEYDVFETGYQVINLYSPIQECSI